MLFSPRTAIVLGSAVGFSCIAAATTPFAWPTARPVAMPAPSPTVLWDTVPAASFQLEVRPLGVTPDGDARALVAVVFRDANGAVVDVRHGTDFDYFPNRGTDQWQTRLRFGGPGTIVSERSDGPVTVRVVSNRPKLGQQTVSFDTRSWRTPRVVGAAVGPHLARIGWFPQVTRGAVTIFRVDARGIRRRAATLAAPASSWSDPTVEPGHAARYAVLRPGMSAQVVTFDVPPELPRSDASVMRAKGAWLAFSGDPRDDDGYTALDVDRIVETAKHAGLRSVELRLAYGAFDEVTPPSKATIDDLIDKLTDAGVAVVGWTVPRAVSYEDLALNAAVAAYRTPRGTRLAGLAVDLERGDEFLGDGKPGFVALSTYLRELRRAVGPHVLLVATVEDPFLEHLDGAKFPYAAIAADADVLQPMTYWRMMGPWDTVPKVRMAVTSSVELVRRLAGRPDMPINVGAQTGVLSKRGAPPGDEVAAAVEASRKAGALGIMIYDWPATGPEQWEALATAPW